MNVRVTPAPAATAAHDVEGTLPQHGMETERPTSPRELRLVDFGQLVWIGRGCERDRARFARATKERNFGTHTGAAVLVCFAFSVHSTPRHTQSVKRRADTGLI